MVEHSCDHGLGLACGGALHLGISLGSAPAQWSVGTVATRWRRTTSRSRPGGAAGWWPPLLLSSSHQPENRFEIFFFHDRLFRLTGGHCDICKAGTTS